jgi:hypothetical protein
MKILPKNLRNYGTWMDLLPNEQNFDLDKSRQKFYHGLKEHHKISNIHAEVSLRNVVKCW